MERSEVSSAASGWGRAASRPAVYGWRAWLSTWPVCPDSTTRPAYITVSQSAIDDITPRSWVIITTESPDWRRRLSSSRRMPACTVTSSAVVGSSAMRMRGPQASAIAMAMR